VAAGDRTRVEAWLTEQLPRPVKVLGIEGKAISPDLLLGFNAAVEDNLDSRPSHHDHDHDHDDDIVAIPIVLDRGFEPKALLERLEHLTAHHEIYRIKGFVDVPNKAMRLVVHGVGKRFDSFFDRPWQVSERRQTRLVVIGKNLDAEAVRVAIAA
jgi:cobalamin biosynthesis protein CobW